VVAGFDLKAGDTPPGEFHIFSFCVMGSQ
jgi:hypothetical protein